MIEHDGAWQASTTVISRHVYDALSMVVLTNLEGAALLRIAHEVAAIYLRGGGTPGSPA